MKFSSGFDWLLDPDDGLFDVRWQQPTSSFSIDVWGLAWMGVGN
jgi:hypothetical protein